MSVTLISADNACVGAVCDASEFDGMLVVPASRVHGRQHLVSVDLAQTGGREGRQPGSRITDQRIFDAFVPSVIITLWEPVYAQARREREAL